MKEITLVRHGKSSWKHEVSDFYRPLTSRGVLDAKLVANQYLKAKNSNLGVVFSSPAKRASTTCKLFSEIFNRDENSIHTVKELYDFDGTAVINFIKNLPNEYDTVTIFGHNNALTSISNRFGSVFIDNLPTSGLVKLNFNIDNWADFKQGTTEFIILPKTLK